MIWPTRCKCPCHFPAPNNGVDVKDPTAAVMACEGCSSVHRVTFAKESPHRKQGFDITEPFKPDTSTAWNDDQGDGDNGRDNAP